LLCGSPIKDMFSTFWQSNEKGIRIGILYTCLLLALGAYFNYAMPYDPNPVMSPSIMQLMLWTFTYVPLGIFVVIANWNVTEFGFCVTRSVGLALIIIIPLCGSMAWNIQIPWQSALIEAFARTGEEIFFRGFLFALLLKIFNVKTKPWIWAVLISALLFALVHTQTFQASFLDNYGSGPIIYRIFERLLNIFLLGVFFALLRHWTQSIFPGAIIHSLFQGGIFTLPFCFIIYASITLWAYVRKESVMKIRRFYGKS